VEEALLEMGAGGVLTPDAAAALTREFMELAKSAPGGGRSSGGGGGGGEPGLNRATCVAVFARIGIHDAGIANRLFDAWDTDRTGVIDIKEFVHAIVLSQRGSHHDKLNMAYTIMDTDADGTCPLS